jgi:hypothetical protein
MIPQTTRKWLVLSVILLGIFSGRAIAGENESIVGLWRLMAVMPAGAPSQEIPEDLSGNLFYWFHRDGTLTLLVEEGAKRNQRVGLWKVRGQRLMIALQNGPKFVVGIVTSATDHLVLAGIDTTPRWFRFTRVF